MKTLLMSLILSLCILGNAQNYGLKKTAWERWGKSVAVAGIQVTSIALEAWGDAEFDMGNKILGHSLQAASVGVLVAAIPALHLGKNDVIAFSLSYLGWRVGTFDAFYNQARGLPWDYIGNTCNYDKVMSKIPPFGRSTIKGWCIGMTIGLTIKEF